MEKLAARIQQVLDRAEAEVRDAGADAFRTGDDLGAGQAREIVLALKGLRSRLNGHAASDIPARRPARTKSRSRSGKRAAVRAPGKGYPRYEVRNGSLIRTGWSKKQKSEYQHKAPRAVFDRTVGAMAELALTGTGPFTAERLVEHSADATGPVPGYQAYVVIGLLRDHGCLEQVGREGYMIPADVASRASPIWELLAGGEK